MSESSETAIPRQIGAWNVVRLLGKGGMAEVYEVEDEKLGSRYALKLFTYDRAEWEMARTRFFSEGRLLAKLDHPRLVRVYEVEEDAATGRPYFVMDLVLSPDGKPRTLADADTPDEDQVATWYEDLREGLGYIHRKGILHRDLKLQNVLIGPDGHVILSDFGVAKIFNPELSMDLGVSLEQTLVAAKDGRKTVMGSVGYMAPEVEMGVAASKESDWYALGVLVFRLLTGVWCDSRTDVVGDLETYSPVWKEILPALLHSNPAGRSCPSWTELVRAQHERESLKAEQELAAVRDKLRRAKGAKKILVPICAVGLVVLAAGAGVMYRLSDKVADKRVTSFEQIVVIPEDAPLNEGVSPSDEQYRQARIDAWAFLCDEFIELSKGELGVLDLATKMSDLARRIVEDDVDDEDESDLPGFIRFGENDPLALLLYRGAERLFRRGGFTSEAERAAAGAEKILKRRQEGNR